MEGCGERWVLAKEMAQCAGIPLPYLSKTLHALGGSGLIEAKRGYRGGFRLAKPAGRITLLDIAEAVEGEGWLPRCLLGLESCTDDRACPTHTFWTKQREKIEAELRRRTLCDVARFERNRRARLGVCKRASNGHD
jgi:Rrf2 family protein